MADRLLPGSTGTTLLGGRRGGAMDGFLNTLLQTPAALLSAAPVRPPLASEIVYLSPHLIALPFPSRDRKHADPSIVNALHSKHSAEHVMVWNLSEVSYDGLASIEFKFPGHPSAPLGALFELCSSLDSWLEADSANVAALHCISGKGRTLTILACYLTWTGQFVNPMDALAFCCQKKGDSVGNLTIPSQRRYVEYFGRAMEGVRPRAEAIVLKHVRVCGAPSGSLLQVYVDGALVYSEAGEENADLAPGEIVYTLDKSLDGDVLIRVRVEDLETKTRASLFRAALHTGYTPSGTWRLEHKDLDGGKEGAWMELHFDARGGPTASSPARLAKGVATSEAAFWELVSRKRAENKRRMERSEHFSIGKEEVKVVEEDELERELGALLTPAKPEPAAPPLATTPAATATAAAPSPSSKPATPLDDQMDELEAYLKELG